MTEPISHLVVFDTQVADDTPTQHLDWIGAYIRSRKPTRVIHVGDNWDMRSLNRHRSKLELEGARYVADIESGNAGLAKIKDPATKAGLDVDWHFLDGNHEEFVSRALEEDPRLEGTISKSDMLMPGWTRHGFLEPVNLDGVVYSHYFYAPLTGNPYSGTIDNRLKQIGHSFTMGHQQTLLYGVRFVAGRSQHGLVCGSTYLHDEKYKGPQANAHWRGIVVKHQVKDGTYDPMFVSLDYLCRRYEGMTLERFKKLNRIRSCA